MRGQTLVELALVFPLFFVVLIAVIEFVFLLNANLSIGFASRDASLIAAEAGSNPGADCAILQAVEQDVGAPAGANNITSVTIYWADANGTIKAPGASNVWTRTPLTPTPCKLPSGAQITIPYSPPLFFGYPVATRCNITAGCPLSGGHPGLDTIGVTVAFSYVWHTPIAAFSSISGTSGSGVSLSQSNAMRMEPIL